MKNKKILLTLSSLLILAGILSFFVYKFVFGNLDNSLGQNFVKGPIEIEFLCMAYKGKQARWPKSVTELQQFLKDNKGEKDFDINSYQGLTFSNTSTNTLKIHYAGYKNGDITSNAGDLEIK